MDLRRAMRGRKRRLRDPNRLTDSRYCPRTRSSRPVAPGWAMLARISFARRRASLKSTLRARIIRNPYVDSGEAGRGWSCSPPGSWPNSRSADRDQMHWPRQADLWAQVICVRGPDPAAFPLHPPIQNALVWTQGMAHPGSPGRANAESQGAGVACHRRPRIKTLPTTRLQRLQMRC